MTELIRKKTFNSKKEMSDSIADVLKELRKGMNLTQTELEAMLGFGSEYISKIERKKTKVNLELLRRFTLVFNTSISEIITKAEKNNGID